MTNDETTGTRTDPPEDAGDGGADRGTNGEAAGSAGASGGDAAPPPPPPPRPSLPATTDRSGGTPPPPDRRRAPGWSGSGFDLGYLFSFFFQDPRVAPKLLFGCLAFLFIPVLGVGLVALAGFGLGTARGVLRGDEHPMPEWDDLGAILLDGLKVAVVALAYGAAAAVAGVAFLVFGAFWGLLTDSVESPAVAILGVFGVIVSLFFVAFLILVLNGLLPVGLLRLAATDRLGDAFRLGGHLGLIQAHLGTFLFLLLTLILFHLLTEATILLCLIGIVPGTVWGVAASGAAIGHAGRLMGLRLEEGAGAVS